MSPAAVTREIGLNNSSPTAWKRGAIPKGETLQKIANYFGVSVDYLLTDTWGIKAGGKIKAGGGIKSRYGIKAGGGVEAGGPIEVGPGVFDASIRVHVSPEQKEFSDLLRKEADGSITKEELRRLGELLAKQPSLEESLEKLTATLNRLGQCLIELNDVGQQKVEDYAQDLTRIPEYQAQRPPQSSLTPQEGRDTTPPTDAPGEAQEGE